MSFVSLRFLALLAASLVLCFLLPKKVRWIALLAASVIFYAMAGAELLVYLASATLSTFLAGLVIDRLNRRRAAAAADAKAKGLQVTEINTAFTRKKRAAAAAALLLNFGILAALKYLDPFLGAVEYVSRIFGGVDIPRFTLALPLGISFYTFQSASYVIDLLREKYPASRNILKYALFVSYFPQITQGPIGRYDRLSPQFENLPGFNADALRNGIQLAVWGLFKKIVIADRAAVIADNVFAGYDGYGGVIILFGVFVYGIQLYCDFSGGIDMARGISEMFGVELAENFRRPYLATSLADYWRRWHITLGEWMREYVFYSITFSRRFGRFSKKLRTNLGGRAGKVLPTALVTFVVFFLIGLWHGGSSKYIAFGLWNGVIITFSQLMAAPYAAVRARLKISDSSKLLYAFRLLRTLLLVTLGRYFTRADNLSLALGMLSQTFAHPGVSALSASSFLSLGLGGWDMGVLALGSAVVTIAGVYEERNHDLRAAICRARPVLQIAIMLAIILAVVFLGFYRSGYIPSEFIYKAF